MKKLIVLLLVCVLCLSVLVACKGECESCGQTAELQTVEINGESADLCEDCAALVELGKAFAGLK